MRIIRIMGASPINNQYGQTIWAEGYDDVTRIEEVTENHGTYGISWFKCYNDKDELVGKMNALYVANVEYK